MSSSNTHLASASSYGPFDLTDEQRTLRDSVELASSKLPKIIFRGWRSDSGGYADLNTTTAITPLAFSHHNGGQHPSKCFYHLSKSKIHSIATMHLYTERNEPTVYSSWSQTLATALAYAAEQPSSYISILDTTRLSKWNVLLHTAQMVKLGLCALMFPYELLAFGVITGPAHQAVPREQFMRLVTPLKRNPTETSAVREVLDALFREDFRPAVAAHCLAHSCTLTDSSNVDGLKHFYPEGIATLFATDWRDDPKVIDLESSFLQGFDPSGPALYAAKLIREYIRAYPRPVQRPANLRRDKELQRLRINMNW